MCQLPASLAGVRPRVFRVGSDVVVSTTEGSEGLHLRQGRVRGVLRAGRVGRGTRRSWNRAEHRLPVSPLVFQTVSRVLCPTYQSPKVGEVPQPNLPMSIELKTADPLDGAHV